MDGKTNHMIGVKCILVSVDPMLKLIEMPFILQSQKREVYDHDACIRRLSTRSALLVAYNNHANFDTILISCNVLPHDQL